MYHVLSTIFHLLLIPFHRSLVANLGAANNFKKSHIELPENISIINNAKYIYVGVSHKAKNLLLRMIFIMVLMVVMVVLNIVKFS